MKCVLVALVLAVCLIQLTVADVDDIVYKVEQVRHNRHLNQYFARPGQCGFSPTVVVYGARKPELSEIGEIWPIARYGDDQVEYIPKSKLSCIAKATALPGDLIVYDDGLLGDLEEFSNIAQINGHLIFKGAGAKSGPGLASLNGFKSLRLVIGSLNILDMVDLEDIEGLGRLSSVGQDIVLWNTGKIRSLKGLQLISRIGQSLYLDNNRGLKSLEGLENLEQIGFDFFLKGNGQIEDLAPLKNLKKIFGNIIIEGNNALKTLEAFDGLTDVGIGIDISNNAILPDLKGFEVLTAVSGDVFVMGNPALTSLDGLDNVEEIGLNLIITRNAVLDDLRGLGSCKRVGGLISIADNDSLTSLKGTKAIKEVGEDVLIHRNPKLTTLSDISVERVGTNLGGNVQIEDNPELVGFGMWGLRLKDINGGVRIQRNNPGMSEKTIKKLKSKAVQA